MLIRLGEIAYARSGDKGNRANIGVVSRLPQFDDWIGMHLSAEAVAAFLKPLEVGKVVRYRLPGIHAYNFVIENALGGGASRSLRIDTQGKAIATALLEMPIPRPEFKT